MDFSTVDQEIIGGVEREVFPGAVVLVNQAKAVVYRRACGWRSVEPERRPVHETTIFDLASLTKPLATTTALMLMVKEKMLRLDDRLTRFFPNFAIYGKNHITFRHLLSHSSGLPAWRPYYRDIAALETREGKVGFLGTRSAREFVYTQLQREKLEAEPGQRAVYSDLGFILLGATIEAVSGMSLEQYCHEKIFRPLGLQSLSFINVEALRLRRMQVNEESYASTEDCPWRKRVLRAEVHDDNAYAMGGVAGHAGLFSTIDDVDKLVSVLVACYRGEHAFIPQPIMQTFWTRADIVPSSTWCLGWDSPSPQKSSAGDYFSSHSVGHLGFTGTSLWIDLDRHLHVIVLTNRVHPHRTNDAIQAFRPALHNAVMRVILGKRS